MKVCMKDWKKARSTKKEKECDRIPSGKKQERT